MSTPDPARACPALHILNGAMGLSADKQPLHPAHDHHPQAHGICRHCGRNIR